MSQRTIRPTIADVAREAGVSKTAVSFAFNTPARLKPETADRIREVAETLGYRPHPVARMLTQRRTMTVGILTPQALSVIFTNPFIGAFSEGCALAAEESGYSLQFISPVHGSLLRAIGRATVDGVVAMGLQDDHPEVEQIRRAGVPMVMVDSSAMAGMSSIDVDDEGGARSAAEHLVELGHRDMVVLGVQPPPPATSLSPDGVMGRRLRGYRAALAHAGVSLGDERVVVGPASIAGGAVAFERAWDAGIRPTAILSMSDAMAIGALRTIRERGLTCPRDISVVGFDDIDLASHTDPPLTTVHQPTRQKGEEAVRMLLSLEGRPEFDEPVHRRLATRLVIRDSTARAPHARQEVAGAQD